MKVSLSGRGAMTETHKKDNEVTQRTADVAFGASDFTKINPIMVTFERKIQPAPYESTGLSITMPIPVVPEDYVALKAHLDELRSFVEDFLRESSSPVTGAKTPPVSQGSKTTTSAPASFEDELASLDSLNL